MTTTVDGRSVIVADTAGVITCWNPVAETLFGHPARDAGRRSLDLVVPAHLRQAHWAGFRRAMREPQVKDLAANLPVLCADGEIREVAGRLLVVCDGVGVALGAMAICTPDATTTGVHPFR
ncbi:PAS domain S-box protein [Allosaccharopolyspora coralli]|uniref:PAS domain S-box protein n=1 Tax=Allosaccharopolyspora coralli TaxID=2665642 RepID=UPI001651D760|nr:PAS domain S-box protein [Allosaccharopolyspora coralli]